MPCFALHPWQSLHPPHLHQAYLSKAALSSHFMLPADTANSSYPKLDASSFPSMLTHPFHPTLCLYAEDHSRLVIGPILPSPLPTVSPHETQPAKLPLCPWRHGACLILVAVSMLCPCLECTSTTLPLTKPIHLLRPSSDFACSPDLFFYLCIFAFVSSI